MNCPNCGAAMELIESRRYFRCRHCGTYHFPERVEAGGIRVVGHVPHAPQCPACSTGMAHALMDDDHPIDFCARCRGILLPRSTFATVTSKRRAWATSPPAEPVPFDRQELHRQLACPRCGGRFETYPNYGPGNVVIDNCARCDLIWLDFGEMEQIVDAPGRDRGTRRVPIENRESGPRREASDDDVEGPSRRGRRINDPLRFLVDLTFED